VVTVGDAGRELGEVVLLEVELHAATSRPKATAHATRFMSLGRRRRRPSSTHA